MPAQLLEAVIADGNTEILAGGVFDLVSLVEDHHVIIRQNAASCLASVAVAAQGVQYTLRTPAMKRKAQESSKPKATRREYQFYAEGDYADSILRNALGDREGCVTALKRALEAMPTYAPAILSMGSVEYQAGRIAEGRELFQSLLS